MGISFCSYATGTIAPFCSILRAPASKEGHKGRFSQFPSRRSTYTSNGVVGIMDYSIALLALSTVRCFCLIQQQKGVAAAMIEACLSRVHSEETSCNAVDNRGGRFHYVPGREPSLHEAEQPAEVCCCSLQFVSREK